MTLKKWIYISAAALFLATAVILSVTAGLIKWRKKANYPPSSAAITARSSIRFVPRDTALNSEKSSASKSENITEIEKETYKGYVRFYAEEPASGFIAFQTSLDRYGLNISDVTLLFPHSMFNINIENIKSGTCTVNVDRPASIAACNTVIASFVLNNIDFSFDYQGSKIVSAIGVAEVNVQDNQKLSDTLPKHVYEGFLQDAGNYKSRLIIKTSIFENSDSSGQLLLIIDEISYKVI